MTTAIAISPMMRNVLSVATIPPAAVTASQMARIAPRIVPMIRPMSPVCGRDPWKATVVSAGPAWGWAGREVPDYHCRPSTALATVQPTVTDAERLALAGYRGLTRVLREMTWPCVI